MKRLKMFTAGCLLAGINLPAMSQFDLTISPTIVSPVDGCQLSNSETVTVFVVNAGSSAYNPPNSYDISYSLDGGAPVTETVVLSFPFTASASFIYSFTVPADLSSCGVHTLDFTIVASVAESNTANNTLSVNVISDCPAVAGSIVGPDTVCSGLNSGNLTVVGYTGNVQNWVQSIDWGATWNWISNTTDTQPYTNISSHELWWVLMESPYGLCPDDSTEIDTIEVIPQSVGGVLPADFDICDNGNGGIISLTGYVGSVLNWEYSNDNGVTWNTIWNTDDTLVYSNLMDTIMYQVQVQNGAGICPAVYSSPVTLTLIPGSDAGSVVGELLVCNFENDSSLEVNPVVGNVVDWLVSSDNGATFVSSGVSDTIYQYNGLLGYTVFAAIIQEGSCPYDTAFHSIVVLPLAVSAGPNVNIFEDDSTQLVASGGVDFLWFPDYFMSDPNVYNPTVWPDITTTYNVQITDINGCMDTASVTVTVLPNVTDILIPNLLTPNADNYNDIFIIPNLDTYPSNELTIFDAYGQVIYQASPYNNDWEATYMGSTVPDGTYFYILDLKDPVLAPEPYQGIITIIGND